MTQRKRQSSPRPLRQSSFGNPFGPSPWQTVCISHSEEITRWQVDVGNVVSNSFKRHGWCCEFIPSLPDIAQCDNCGRKNGINKWSPRKWGKFILTCVVLLWWLSMLRGISAGKYDEGNMSRGNIYVAYFLLLLLLFFQRRTPLLQPKPPINRFRQWIIMRGYFFP